MAQVKFETCFKQINDKLYVRPSVSVNGVMSQSEIELEGRFFGGVDWNMYKGHDLEVEIKGDKTIIKGIY